MTKLFFTFACFFIVQIYGFNTRKLSTSRKISIRLYSDKIPSEGVTSQTVMEPTENSDELDIDFEALSAESSSQAFTTKVDITDMYVTIS
jgi:hypothetical protein